MGEYHIFGENRLNGEIKINGGKNAILPILAAVTLNGGVSVLHNCPEIADTINSIKILEALGCRVKKEGRTLIIDSGPADKWVLPESLVGEMRSSIIFLGGLLGRFKEVKSSYPGGCELGLRPIDLHLNSLRKFGVEVVDEHGFIDCNAKKLTGTKINLDFPSVGATENLMLTGVLAEGQTIISNAAREPEIIDLQKFLNGMGADIRGAGTGTIVIRGVKKLHDVEHTVIPDRIVAGTFMVAAAITKGRVVLNDVEPTHLYPLTSKLMETGCEIEEEHNRIILRAPEKIKPLSRLRTLPHPGFPTDLQPQMMSLLSVADGTSFVEETVFESRNKHIGELIKMGADINLSYDGMTSTVRGVPRLKGAVVPAKDLRGGAALVIAGLAAQGKTVVTDVGHINRGYEKMNETLVQLGAKIKLV